MKAAIQRLMGMSMEQDTKVKQAQDALATAERAVIAGNAALAEAIQHAADYRQALAVLRRPEAPIMVPAAMVQHVEESKPSRKRA